MIQLKGCKIAVEATLVGPGRSGIGYHMEHLIRALAATGEIGEILLLSHRRPEFSPPVPPGLRWSESQGFPWRAPWMQALLPRLIRREQPALTHYINFLAPIFWAHPYVVTIHDLSLYKHPEFYGWQKRWLTGRAIPRVARQARAVITVSSAMRTEIISLLGMPAEKVFVTYPGPAELFVAHRRRILERGRPPTRPDPPYILFVGNLEPRKNLARLLQAFDLLKSESRLPHQLWVVGGRGWRRGLPDEAWRGLRHADAVRRLDYVPEADLPALYGGADLFVFPSLYEGFGVPPLEAMCCGTPVVASDLPVHREVNGDAAIYVDPLRPEAICAGLRALLEDPELAAIQRERGFRQAAMYGWDRTARQTLEVYRRVLET